MPGKTVTMTELAELYGVSRPAVAEWTRRGCPVKQKGGRGKEWQFNTAAVQGWREDQAATRTRPDMELEEARRRKTAAEMALAELELSREQAKVVDVDSVEEIIGTEYPNVRRVISGLASADIAKRAMDCHRISECREVLESSVRAALDELSSDHDSGA